MCLSQYAGFAEGYYTSQILNSDTVPVNYDGRPESFPKWSYGGDASYVWNLGGYALTAESNYSFHDTYSQFYLLGSSAFTIPKYWLANANLSLAPAGGPWAVSLWGRNIFNKEYDVTRNFFLPNTNVAQAGAPATFGVRFNYRYWYIDCRYHRDHAHPGSCLLAGVIALLAGCTRLARRLIRPPRPRGLKATQWSKASIHAGHNIYYAVRGEVRPQRSCSCTAGATRASTRSGASAGRILGASSHRRARSSRTRPYTRCAWTP